MFFFFFKCNAFLSFMLREKVMGKCFTLVSGAVPGGHEAKCSHRALKAEESHDTCREGGESEVKTIQHFLYPCTD